MSEITMPKLSDSMEEGKIIEWKVKEGDEVHEGDILAEVESDKAAMELECFEEGVLAKIVHGDGAEVPVGHVIAYITASGEETTVAPEVVQAAPLAEQPAPPTPQPVAETPPPPIPAPRPAGARVAISPYARKLAQQHGIDFAQVQGTGPGGRIVARDIEAAAKPQPPAPEPRPAGIEPMAHAVAKQHSVDLAHVAGTGLGGRITVDDVLAVHEAEKALHAPKPTAADEELPELKVSPDEADVEDAPFRLKTQARRVVASKHVIPHFYMTRGVEVTRLLETKADIKAAYGATVTHLLILACVKAIGQHPDVNRSWDRGRIITWKGIHIGLAIDAKGGLTVAVLRNAHGLSLEQIVASTRALVARAREGKLSADDRRNPTFTISNLGMFDVEHFQPIINPPSAVTLGVSSALPSAVVQGDGIRVGQVMRLTLSCDHRIIEGATAARFLADLKALLEDPERLLEGQ